MVDKYARDFYMEKLYSEALFNKESNGILNFSEVWQSYMYDNFTKVKLNTNRF